MKKTRVYRINKKRVKKYECFFAFKLNNSILLHTFMKY